MPSASSSSSSSSFIWKFVCAFISIAVGVSTFVYTQKVTSAHFEPILAACIKDSTTGAVVGGIGDTNASETSINTIEINNDNNELIFTYHPYEGKLGGVFVCLITQFIHDLTIASPIGFIVWSTTILAAIVACTLVCSEAGRTTNSRSSSIGILLRFPELFLLLGQLLGISVVIPTLWVPLCILYGTGGTNYNNTVGAISPMRAYLSPMVAVPYVVGTVLIFFVYDASTYQWTFTAGLLGGPLIACTPILLRFLSPTVQKNNTPESVAKGCFAIANTYIVTAVIGFLLWIPIVITTINEYGADITQFWKDAWFEAHPSVAFMTLDAIGLYVGLVVYIMSQSGIFDAIVLLFLLPTLGPGASCAVTLARFEIVRGEIATAISTKKTS